MKVEPTTLRVKVEEIVQASRTPPTSPYLPFTPATRKVLELSVEAASNLGHDYIGTEHLLLGLIVEKEGIASRVLRDLGVEFEATRDEILEFLRHVPRFSRDD